MKLLLFFVFWVVMIFSNFGYSYGKQLTIQPGPEDGKDSYISTSCGDQSKNFGNSEDIYVGYYDSTRGLLQFDLSSIPPDAVISSARLYLYLETSPYGSEDTRIYVHRITNLWKEEEVTWRDKYEKKEWDSPGGDFDWSVESWVSLTETSSGWVSWDVTRMAKEWFNGRYDNFGFLLRQDIYNRIQSRFLSTDAKWKESRPRLVIFYELKEIPPEPVPPEVVSLPVKVYPNPFKPAQGHNELEFVNLPSGASIKIFCIDGEIVRTLQERDGKANWDVKDSDGNEVSSGFYFYLIETERKRQSGKVVIIR